MPDTALREGNPPAGMLASPVAQYDLSADGQGGKERTLGSHGAPRAQLYDKDGNPIDSEHPLEVKVRQIETLLGALTDDLVAAGATGSVSAKLRRLTGDLDALLVKIGEVQASPTSNTLLARVKALEIVLGTTTSAAVTDPAAAADAIAAMKGLLTDIGQTTDNTVDAGANGSVSAKLKRVTSTLGQTDDAVGAAGAAGSLSAKLRRLTTDIDAMLTRLGAAADVANATGSLHAKLRQLIADLQAGTAKVTVSGTTPLLTTHQNAVSATGNGAAATVTGFGAIVFAVAGTFVGTVTFEGSVDGVTYHPIPVVSMDGARSFSTTASGLYRADVSGLQTVRARVTWTSGTSVTVTSRALPIAAPRDHSTIINGVAIPGGTKTAWDAQKFAPVGGAKTATTVAAELFAGAGKLANRYVMKVTNESSVPVYMGPAAVTTANGDPILPGDTWAVRMDPAVATAWYIIAGSNAAVRVLELA